MSCARLSGNNNFHVTNFTSFSTKMEKSRREMKTWWFNFPLHVDDMAHLIDLLPGRQTHTPRYSLHSAHPCVLVLCVEFCFVSFTPPAYQQARKIFTRNSNDSLHFSLPVAAGVFFSYLFCVHFFSSFLCFLFVSFLVFVSTKTLYTQYFVYYTRAQRTTRIERPDGYTTFNKFTRLLDRFNLYYESFWVLFFNEEKYEIDQKKNKKWKGEATKYSDNTIMSIIYWINMYTINFGYNEFSLRSLEND